MTEHTRRDAMKTIAAGTLGLPLLGCDEQPGDCQPCQPASARVNIPRGLISVADIVRDPDELHLLAEDISFSFPGEVRHDLPYQMTIGRLCGPKDVVVEFVNTMAICGPQGLYRLIWDSSRCPGQKESMLGGAVCSHFRGMCSVRPGPAVTAVHPPEGREFTLIEGLVFQGQGYLGSDPGC